LYACGTLYVSQGGRSGFLRVKIEKTVALNINPLITGGVKTGISNPPCVPGLYFSQATEIHSSNGFCGFFSL
jgi:hypothetical protein